MARSNLLHAWLLSCLFAASPALFASADEVVEARQVNEFHAGSA